MHWFTQAHIHYLPFLSISETEGRLIECDSLKKRVAQASVLPNQASYVVIVFFHIDSGGDLAQADHLSCR